MSHPIQTLPVPPAASLLPAPACVIVKVFISIKASKKGRGGFLYKNKSIFGIA